MVDTRLIPQMATNRPSAAFNNALINIKSIDQIKQEKAMRPITQQLAEIELRNQQGASRQATEERRFESVVRVANQILPALESKDIDGVRGNLSARRDRLIEQDLPTTDTDKMLALLDSNPKLLEERSRRAVEMGSRFGLKGLSGAQRTPRQRELDEFSRLPESTAQEKTFKKQFGQAIGAIAKRPDLQEKIDVQRGVGDIKVEQDIAAAGGKEAIKLREQIKAIPEQERVQFLSENKEVFNSDIIAGDSVMEDIDRAIEIWESAPSTISGPLAGRTPAFADLTQELESILAKLGVDRLSAFKGATSEKEMLVAFRGGASIEQDAVAGIRRLKKQRKLVGRNSDRLRGLKSEANGLLAKSRARAAPDQEPQVQTQPAQQRQGGQIMIDAQGNKAMVFPDGTFEEVQ